MLEEADRKVFSIFNSLSVLEGTFYMSYNYHLLIINLKTQLMNFKSIFFYRNILKSKVILIIQNLT